MAENEESRILSKLTSKEREKHNTRKLRLEQCGWVAYQNSEKQCVRAHGYFGVAYYRIDPTTQTAEVVFAHRATRFDERDSIIADIAIA